MTYEQEAIEFWQARINEQEYPSDYGGEDFWKDDGWILSVSYAPTQSKQEEIAFEMLVEDLEEEDEDNIDVVRFNHWACGWVKQINVRPIIDGKLTKAGEMVYEYHNDNGYDYLERVYEHSKANDLSTDMVPYLHGSDMFSQSFRPHIENVSAMQEIIRAYYASVNSYSQYDWVKDFTLTTTFKCNNFGISISFKENKETTHEEE